MATSKVYYPHGIYLTGGSELTTIMNVRPANNFSDLTEFSASEAGPQFTGTHQAAPDIRFDCNQIGTLFGVMAGADYDVIKSYAAGNVVVEYKSGANLGVRDVDGGNTHVKGTFTENACLIWESFRVRQGGLVEAQCRLGAVYNAASGVDPMVMTAADQDLTITSAVPSLFTLGLQKLNSTSLVGVEEIDWQNNIEYEEVHSDGDGFLSYLAVKKMSPVCRIMTNNIAYMNTYGSRGTALSDFTSFLRKKAASGINVADATAEHIKLVATTGTIKAREITGSRAMCQLEVAMTSAAQSTGPFAITASVAIS